MAEKIEMGMAVASGDDSALAEAKFSAFSRVESKPVAETLSVALDEDTSVEIILTGSDDYGSSLIYTVTSQPTNGVLTGTVPNLTYTPDADYFGADSFTFTVNDGFADSDAATVSITVNPIEDPPVFGAQAFPAVIRYDGFYSNSLAGSVIDPEGGAITYSLISGPSWLNVSTNGTLSGTPGISDVGPNSWTILATDETGALTTGTVYIAVVDSVLIGYDFDSTATNKGAATVVPVGVTASQFTSPMAISFSTTVGDNSGVDAAGLPFGSISMLGCVGIGVDDAVTYSFEDAVAGDDYMTFTLTPDIGVTLKLYAAAFKASKTKSTSVDEYAVTDGSGNLIGTAVSVTNVNGQTATYDSFSINLSGTAYGTITEATEFRIYAWGRGSTSLTSTLAMFDKLTLYGSVGSNIVPIADARSVWVNQKDSVAITLYGLDPEGSNVTYNVVSNPTHGALSGSVPDLTYTPNLDYYGSDAFAYTVNDGALDSAEATVSITVVSALVNGVPFSWLESYELELTEAATLADTDGDKLSNLAEYALGGVPTNAASTGYPISANLLMDSGTNWVEYVYPRRIGTLGSLDYYLETSSNLLSNDWARGAYLELPNAGALSAEFESVTNRLETTGKTNEFIRLRIDAL
jgi:hypothetical protein